MGANLKYLKKKVFFVDKFAKKSVILVAEINFFLFIGVYNEEIPALPLCCRFVDPRGL